MEAGPLFRVDLLQVHANRHILLVAAHHIIMDGWSMGLLLSEIEARYNYRCTGQITTEGPVMQHRAYVAARSALTQQASFQEARSFWKQKFSAPIPLLELPVDKKRPEIKTYNGRSITRTLRPGVIAALREDGKRKGLTPFVLLLSAYTLLLHKLSGQDEVIIGIPVAGRNMEEDTGLIGYCANLLPVKSVFEETMTLDAYLLRMRRDLMMGFDHQDYALSHMLKEWDLPRDKSRSPFFINTF